MNLLKSRPKHLSNEEGQAVLEAVFLIPVFIVFFAYGMGLFGAIHSGILFSISSRNYAFETFRNRTNTNIFRYSSMSSEEVLFYYSGTFGFRYHTVQDENDGQIRASSRGIVKGMTREPAGNDAKTHNVDVFENVITAERNEAVSVHPIWLMVGYGLCINAQCGSE